MILFLTALPLLAGCETLDPYERLNFIRDRIAPKLELQIEKNQKKEPEYANIHLGAPTYLRIFKEESVLEAWLQDSVTGRYVLFKTYPICAYSGGLGPKEKEGDLKSPEGFYAIGKNWFRPESHYHLAMNIGYPNDFDKAHGRTGSHLMLHGGCKSDGCYAMNNRQIEELYILAEQSIRAGNESVPVHIFPFRMTGTNLEAHLGDPSMRFWINLKRGYDVFEEIRIPPDVIVKDGLYSFSPDLAAPGGV
ncbi:MAG TPA: 2-dehydro-3-deoxyphosphooctonate aldolase [Rhodospirillaceae bacterium]|nr:2-dehydro-3-deoxyphosphooctonate aldolase [Rhodospirillaceae bacterium]